MPKPKNYRWVCPNCGKGKLAPSRLRKIDVRRYCLPCSEKAGVLVERSVPVLEKKRAEKRQRAQAKAARKAKAKRERERPRRERERRQEHKHKRIKRERREWRERYTRVVTTRPDLALYGSTGGTDIYRRMGVTVLKHNHAHYVPKWAIALRSCVAELNININIRHWANELGHFVTKTKGIEDALIAVCAAEPRRVLPYVVSQYNLPGLPAALRETAAEIEADLAGEESPLLSRFNRKVKQGIVRKMVSP